MSNYIFKRFDDSLIYKLVPLFKDAFGINISGEQIKKKFDTYNYAGIKNIAFVAIDEGDNIIAALYMIFPAIIHYNGQDILCGQVGDLMTHSAHRRKGLFLKLAELTHNLAMQEGMKLVFTFPYGFNSSYKGFVEHLGFNHTESFHSYIIPVNTLPICRIFSKNKITATIYKMFLKFIMIFFYHSENSFREHNATKDGHVKKNKAFFDYKFSYSPGYIIRFSKNSIWLKLTKHGSASIGDLENYLDVQDTISKLKRFCFLTGIRALQIETSPDTDLDVYLRSKYKSDNNYNVCLLRLDNNLPLHKFKFVFGDLDNF
jgi:hypothetical protein